MADYRHSVAEVIEVPEVRGPSDVLDFHWCKNLKTLKLPVNLKSSKKGYTFEKISGDNFYMCGSLENIIIPKENKYLFFKDGALYENIFDEKGNKTGVKLCFVTRPRALSNPEFVIPDYVTIIAPEAFLTSLYFEKITIPQSVVEIQYSAFSNCVKLKEIVLPQSLKVIDSRAFRNCREIRSLEIPESVEELGGGVVLDCKSLKYLRLHRKFRGRFVVSTKCEVEWFV